MSSARQAVLVGPGIVQPVGLGQLPRINRSGVCGSQVDSARYILSYLARPLQEVLEEEIELTRGKEVVVVNAKVRGFRGAYLTHGGYAVSKWWGRGVGAEEVCANNCGVLAETRPAASTSTRGFYPPRQAPATTRLRTRAGTGDSCEDPFPAPRVLRGGGRATALRRLPHHHLQPLLLLRALRIRGVRALRGSVAGEQ